MNRKPYFTSPRLSIVPLVSVSSVVEAITHTPSFSLIAVDRPPNGMNPNLAKGLVEEKNHSFTLSRLNKGWLASLPGKRPDVLCDLSLS